MKDLYNKYKLKIILLMIVAGSNLSVLFNQATVDAATFSMLTFAIIAYVFYYKDNKPD